MLAGVLIAACAAGGWRAHAGSILYVDDDAPAGGNGSSWKTAYRFLQDALVAAADPNGEICEIRIAQGIYLPDRSESVPGGTGDVTASFILVDDLVIRGGYAGLGAPDPDQRDIALYQSVLSGDLGNDDPPNFCTVHGCCNSIHIMRAENALGVTFDGLVIMKGNALSPAPGGGGLYAIGGDIQITNCTFTMNSVEHGDGGGAILSVGTELLIGACRFERNCVNDQSDDSAIRAEAGLIIAVATEFVDNKCDNAVGVIEAEAIFVACTFRDHIFNCGGSGPSSLSSHNASLTVLECLFLDNDGKGGGAMGNSGSVVDIAQSTFDNNNGDLAGAIYNNASTVTIRQCDFISNSGADYPDFGGCITNNSSDVTIVDCRFLGNNGYPQAGGALNNMNTNSMVMNCIFSGNYADKGGAIANFASDPTFINCTFSDNLSDPFYLSDAMWSDSSSAPQVVNCTYWNHQWGAVGGPGTTTMSFSNIERGWSGPGSNNISADPLFVDFDGPDNEPGTLDDNLRLLPGSPCIDAGDNTAVPADQFDLDADGDTAEPIPFDLAGLPRFLDDPKTIDTGNGTPPIVDMGAYEFTGMVNPLDLTGDGVVDAADLAQLLADWGDCPGCPADYTSDGTVNSGDLAELLANWG
jgi:hypothetical protein